jgi:hypothetical protein
MFPAGCYRQERNAFVIGSAGGVAMPIAGPPLDTPLNLAEILKQGLDAKPDADALVSRRRRWSWRMLDSVSTRLAGNYLGLGLVAATGSRR